MNQQFITLILSGQLKTAFIDTIADSIIHEFQCQVIIKEGRIDISQFYDPGRRQYDANKLLKEIDKVASAESVKTLSLFSVDLFIPILTYIFGQAYLGGKAGIASTYRLKNELYGLKPNDDLLLERFNKVCIHELGHSFGLIHCHAPSCVMRSSTYVEDIDQKKIKLCPNCRNELLSTNNYI
jgi:archaemetzincin